MDQILMEQQTSFQKKLTNINRTHHTLDQLQRKMNSYFHHNGVQHYANKQIDKQADNQIQKDGYMTNLMESQNQYGCNDGSNGEGVIGGNNLKDYESGQESKGCRESEQLQFKIYRHKNNKYKEIASNQSRYGNIRNNNINFSNAPTTTEDTYPPPSIKLKQQKQSLDDGFQRLQLQSIKIVNSNHIASQKNKNKQKKQSFLQQFNGNIIIEQRQSVLNPTSNDPFPQHSHYNTFLSKQENITKKNDHEKQQKYSFNNQGQESTELQVSDPKQYYRIGSIAQNSGYQKNKNKLLKEIENVQTLMKERLAVKEKRIQQIQVQIATQNQQRVYLYKINVRLNEQLKYLQQQQAAQDAQTLKNHEQKIKRLEEQLQKLKKQIKKKKDEKKQLKLQQQALHQQYHQILQNRRQIKRNDILSVAKQQQKTKQNNQMLKGLIKELDKLKGVVQSKIKSNGINISNSKAKPIRNFKY